MYVSMLNLSMPSKTVSMEKVLPPKYFPNVEIPPTPT